MATYTGLGGTMTFGGSAVANIQRWTLTVGEDMVDTTAMSDLWGARQGGLASWSAEVECNLDKTTGQSGMLGTIVTTPATTTSVAVVLTVASGKTFTGNAFVSGYAVSGGAGSEKFTARYSLVGTGAPTGWAW